MAVQPKRAALKKPAKTKKSAKKPTDAARPTGRDAYGAAGGMPNSAREAMGERLTDWFEAHRSGELVAFGAAAWIVTARRA